MKTDACKRIGFLVLFRMKSAYALTETIAEGTMIVFVKRSSAVLLLCILILNFALIGMHRITASQSAETEKCILLDAGHGAPDGGCVGEDGTQEAVLNLAVCRQMKAALEARGYRVLMTRTGEDGIHDGGETIAQKKRADMKKRKAMRDSGAAGLFVSIHMNSFSQTQYRGAQVVYDTQNPAAQQLALCIQNALRETADAENKRVPMAAPKSIYLLQQPRIPSVIVECGFLSNPEEREKLKSADYQRTVAEAIAAGIADFDAKKAAGEPLQGETTELKR